MALEIQALVGAETKMCLYFCIWTKFMSDHLIGHFSAVSGREQCTCWCDDDNDAHFVLDQHATGPTRLIWYL
jgi:hypothetical protein